LFSTRQAYQALRPLAAHKTDRNDPRGLAHLARTGFFKPDHVKSLPSHAVRALLIARKKLVGQRVTPENQIRGLAVAFGVRLPRTEFLLCREGDGRRSWEFRVSMPFPRRRSFFEGLPYRLRRALREAEETRITFEPSS